MMVGEKTERYSVKNGTDDEYILTDNILGKDIITGTKEEVLQFKNYLDELLETESYSKDMLIKAQEMLIEYYQKLITDTLFEKLSDVDNMYALKTMLKETCKLIEDLIPKVEGMKKE